MERDEQFAIAMGERIRVVRRSKGYTIERLAELVDISAQHLSDVERGRKVLGSEMLGRLSNVLKTSTDFFIHGIEGIDPRRAGTVERVASLPPSEREQVIKVLEETIDVVKAAQEAGEKASAEGK